MTAESEQSEGGMTRNKGQEEERTRRTSAACHSAAGRKEARKDGWTLGLVIAATPLHTRFFDFYYFFKECCLKLSSAIQWCERPPGGSRRTQQC